MNMKQKSKLNPAASKNIHLNLYMGKFILGSVFLLMAGLAIFRPVSIDVDMKHRMEPPSSTYLLGTDAMGRDLVSCILCGASISLGIGIIVVILSAFTGVILGMISGLSGGITDMIIMRIVDILLAFPGILLAIAAAAFFTPGVFNLILVLTVTGWVEYARLVRGEVLKYKQKEFITAARSYNASNSRIMFHHMVPLVFPLVIIQASSGIAGVILAESSLNFLGMGLSPHIPTLGSLIDAARDYMFDNPILIIAPGSVLFLIVTGFIFLSYFFEKRVLRTRVGKKAPWLLCKK